MKRSLIGCPSSWASSNLMLSHFSITILQRCVIQDNKARLYIPRNHRHVCHEFPVGVKIPPVLGRPCWVDDVQRFPLWAYLSISVPGALLRLEYHHSWTGKIQKRHQCERHPCSFNYPLHVLHTDPSSPHRDCMPTGYGLILVDSMYPSSLKMCVVLSGQSDPDTVPFQVVR